MMTRLVTIFFGLFVAGLFIACSVGKDCGSMPIENSELQNYQFIQSMYADDYFPDHCVAKVETVLVGLCEDIEADQPENLDVLYRLSHAATEEINDLEECFFNHGSELETGAAEIIAMDFLKIARAYGFEADVEELIATRRW